MTETDSEPVDNHATCLVPINEHYRVVVRSYIFYHSIAASIISLTKPDLILFNCFITKN